MTQRSIISRLARLALAAFALATAAAAWGQGFPSKPVRVVVPFAAGGTTDIVARLLGQRLGEIWGQSVVIDNRGGAGGNIGADIVAKAAPDGYTLLMTSGSIVTANQHIYKSMPFDPERDFVAITNVASGPQLIVVNAAFPAKTLRELIDLAKAKPGGYTFGSAGIGSQTHLATENLLVSAGIDLVHAPYKGEGPALADLLGGQISLVTANMAAAIGYVQQGKLRALAVTGKTRSPQMPEVPAAAETLPGFENLGWFGLMAPAGTPKEIVDKVQRDTVKALDNAELRGRLEGQGMVAIGNPPEVFGREIREERARWAQVVKARRIEVK